jgi:hypothetical protein
LPPAAGCGAARWPVAVTTGGSSRVAGGDGVEARVQATAVAVERPKAVLVTFKIPPESVAEAIRAGSEPAHRFFVRPASAFADPATQSRSHGTWPTCPVSKESEAHALLMDNARVRADRPVACQKGCREPGRANRRRDLGESGLRRPCRWHDPLLPAGKVTAVGATGGSGALTTVPRPCHGGGTTGRGGCGRPVAAVTAITRLGSDESVPSRAQVQTRLRERAVAGRELNPQLVAHRISEGRRGGQLRARMKS